MFLRCLLLVVLTSTSWAYYIPTYTPMYLPTYTPPAREFRLDRVDAQAVRVLPEADSTRAHTDTLGVLVASVVDVAAADTQATAWKDTLPSRIQSQIQSQLSRLKPSKLVGAFGLVDDTLWADSIPVYLTRPQPGATTRAILVVGRQTLLTRLAVEVGDPSVTRTLRDVRLPWGLWDVELGQWVAWGRLSLRKTSNDWLPANPSEAAQQLAMRVLQEVPMKFSGSLETRQRRAKWGGLLLGVEGKYGMHLAGEFHDIASDYDLTLNTIELGLSVGWFPSNWGVMVHLPLFSTTQFTTKSSDDDPYSYGSSSRVSSLELYTSFDPSVELIGILPTSKVGVTGLLGIGYQNVTGSTEYWESPPPSGTGWFWRPGVGLYMPAHYGYFASDFAVEFQSANLGRMDFKSTVFSMRVQFGLRLAHE